MRHPRSTRFLALALTLLQGVACYGWRYQAAPPPAQFIAERQPDRVRLTVSRHDEVGIVESGPARVEVLHPRVARDAILGYAVRYETVNWSSRPQRGDSLAIPLSRVHRLEVHVVDPTRTFLACLGVAVLVLTVVGLATFEVCGLSC